MYEDDHYHPANNDSNYKDSLSDLKQMDKGFHKIKRLGVKRVGGDFLKKMVNVEVYCSGDIGSYIRNAVTGQRYSYRVGTSDEDFLFKLGLATGELGLNAGSLFYDSPEQYETHCFTTLSNASKERWYEKNLTARRELS